MQGREEGAQKLLARVTLIWKFNALSAAGMNVKAQDCVIRRLGGVVLEIYYGSHRGDEKSV